MKLVRVKKKDGDLAIYAFSINKARYSLYDATNRLQGISGSVKKLDKDGKKMLLFAMEELGKAIRDFNQAKDSVLDGLK